MTSYSSPSNTFLRDDRTLCLAGAGSGSCGGGEGGGGGGGASSAVRSRAASWGGRESSSRALMTSSELKL